ncbi:hypothetical protein SSAG_01063 [Streptomyces sp. Mg1]|nr:hypothetical protein SSAG_01063 [Streptomyces sp. Mg1]
MQSGCGHRVPLDCRSDAVASSTTADDFSNTCVSVGHEIPEWSASWIVGATPTRALQRLCHYGRLAESPRVSGVARARAGWGRSGWAGL